MRVLRALRQTAHAHPLFPALCAGSLALVRYGAGLGSQEVSLLESQDLSIAAQLFHSFRLSADHSPLHFALLNLWLRLAGASVALVRLPSALFVAAASAVVFRLAERVGGRGAAVWAAVLFTLNPEVVDQARSLRLYGLGILLAALCLERAHAFAFGGRRERALFGFLAAAVIAVHTHLFLWLWVAPLGLLVAVRALAASGGATRRRTLTAGAVAAALMLPQVVHGLLALGFTHERHAIYKGVSLGVLAFVDEIGRHLLLGEAPELLPVSGYLLALTATLPLFGLRRLSRPLRAPALFVCALPLLATYGLSVKSEVEPRYLCFAMPELSVLAALGIVALPVALGEGLGIAVAAISVWSTARAYGLKPIDWREAADRLEGLQAPGDVVAVFPGYWSDTFRFYTHLRELVPVTYPIDLERALLRGKRVFLVVNCGRYAGDIDAYLDATTERRRLFGTEVRDRFDVVEVKLTAPLASPPVHAPATVLFTGVVGSGGYPWEGQGSSVHAFDALRSLVGSADLAVAGYSPLEPPWPAALLLGPSFSAALRPNRAVTEALHAAGVRAVAVSSSFGSATSAASVVEFARLGAVPLRQEYESSTPLVYALGSEHVALISLEDDGETELSDARGTSLVAAARAKLRPTDGLVVFVPASPSFDALPTPAERRTAHRLVEAGADVVIGNGRREAMPVERYGAGIIAYSLGTLLFPSELELVAREATGSALRVQFDGGRAVQFEALPIAFDDRSLPHFGRLATAPKDIAAGFAPFVSAFAKVRAVSHAGAAERALEYVETEAVDPSDALLDRELENWLPWAPHGTSRRPFLARFKGAGSFAGVRGVRSLGVPRAAFELDAATDTSLGLEFPPVTFAARLVVAYALPDDRELSKYRPLLPETLHVQVADGPALDVEVPFTAGWHESALATGSLAGSARRLTLALSSPATHFPVAVELRIEP